MGQNDSTKKLDLWDSINYEGGTFIYGISDLMIKEQSTVYYVRVPYWLLMLCENVATCLSEMGFY